MLSCLIQITKEEVHDYLKARKMQRSERQQAGRHVEQGAHTRDQMHAAERHMMPKSDSAAPRRGRRCELMMLMPMCCSGRWYAFKHLHVVWCHALM